MRRVRRASVGALALLALLLLATVASTGSAHAATAARHTVAADRLGAAAVLPGATLTGSTRVQLTVSLEPNDATGLFAFDRSLTGASPPRHLSERAFEEYFAAPARNVTSLQSYFAEFGATGFRLAPDGLTLRFSLVAQEASAAFATTLLATTTEGSPGWTWKSPPTLPVALASMVYGVGGLSRAASTPTLAAHSVELGRAHGPGTFVVDQTLGGAKIYTGSDYVQAYRETSLFPGEAPPGVNATFSSGHAVATILMSGYNDSRSIDLPPWDPSQITDYFNDTFPSAWPHPNVSGVPVTIAGRTPPAPGSLGYLNDTSFDEAENSLDVEMAGSSAPGARVVNFYFSASLFQNATSGSPLGPIADDFATALGAALSYNYSGARLDAVSNSFGLSDLNDSAWNLELAHAAATGVTVVAASGDQGNAPSALSGRFQGQWPTWPATAAFDSYGTVSVGGVSLNLTGTPTGNFTGGTLPDGFDSNLTGQIPPTAWFTGNDGSGNISGSEGGLSTVVSEPDWQFHSAAQPPISVAGGVQSASLLGRAGPDVAFPANATIAYVAHDANGSYFAVLQGTSIASPFFAGLLAEWSAVAGQPFGWIDPALYRMASYYLANPGAANPFLDVTNGGNFLFSAGPGWDAATGWGGIDASAFLPSYADLAVRDYNYTGPTPGLPTGSGFLNTSVPPLAVTFVLIVLGVGVAGILVVLVVWDERRRRRGVPPSGPYQAPPGVYAPPPPYGFAGPAPPPPSPGTYPPAPPGAGGWGGPMPGAPTGAWRAPPAMFACPYCGAARPAEPVRCPGCGAF
ncbi:MAG: S8 family serine peptidase [Thermoplasmata archaeon]|nr:S8 family serine peptidase [Thermoplasmata archaeon]